MDVLVATCLIVFVCLQALFVYAALRFFDRAGRRLDRIEAELRKLRTGGAALLFLCLCSRAQAAGNAVAVALDDLKRLPPEQQQRTRYLSLAHVPAAERAHLWKVLNFHANALSTEAEIVPLRVLPGGAVSALTLSDYGWEEKLWATLADAEPYHYVKLQEQTAAPAAQRYKDTTDGTFWYKDASGNWTSEADYLAKQPNKKNITALAPWLGDTAAAQALVNLTQSRAPIVRADWWLWQTAIQADRAPGYYDFLSIKDQKDFFRLVGFSQELVTASKRRELLEAVADSTVTLQPRRLGRFPVIDGFLYRTFDNRKALDNRNPLRILNGGFEFDASEEFGTLPNGLIVWGLFNAAGERQDSAPDFIASDSTSHRTDRRVHVNLSCVRCHGVNDGVQPIDGWARNLLRGPLRLQSPDPDILRKLRAQYLRDLQGPIEQDRRLYGKAVAQAAGLKVPQLALAYGDAYAGYDSPVNLEQAAAEVGLTPVEWRKALDRQLKLSGSVDTVLAAFLAGRSVPREQWAEAYPQAALVKP